MGGDCCRGDSNNNSNNNASLKQSPKEDQGRTPHSDAKENLDKPGNKVSRSRVSGTISEQIFSTENLIFKIDTKLDKLDTYLVDSKTKDSTHFVYYRGKPNISNCKTEKVGGKSEKQNGKKYEVDKIILGDCTIGYVIKERTIETKDEKKKYFVLDKYKREGRKRIGKMAK